MYRNALRCTMYGMQRTKNAHECIPCIECTRMQQAMKMHPNLDAFECTWMHLVPNATLKMRMKASKCTNTRMHHIWMRQNAKVCSAMQQMKNAIGWNAMKFLKMHQNALICTGMRMGKNYTTFGKKLHLSPVILDLWGFHVGGCQTNRPLPRGGSMPPDGRPPR